MTRSEESMTLMASYRFSHYDVLSSNRHSEWTQEYRMKKLKNGTVTQSEESITRMTSYRLPHHGYRSFTFASDDALPSGVILNGEKILCEKDRKRNSDTK